MRRHREKHGLRRVLAGVVGTLLVLGLAAAAQAQQVKGGSVVSCTSFFKFGVSVDITEGLQTEECGPPRPFDPQVFTFTNPLTRGSGLLSGPAAQPPLQQILQILFIAPPPSPVEPTAFTTAAPPPDTPTAPSTLGADIGTTGTGGGAQPPAHAGQ